MNRRSGPRHYWRENGLRSRRTVLVLRVACERDSESALRSKLGQWYFLGKTAYFESCPRCTGAMIQVTLAQPRANLAVQTKLAQTNDAFRTDGIAAPDQWNVPPSAKR